MSKKIFIVLTIAVLLITFMNSCQKKGQVNTENGMTKKDGEIVSLSNPDMTLLYWSPEVGEDIEKTIALYEKKYGGKVDVQVAPSFNEYMSKIIAMYSSGQSPDWVGLYDWQAMGLMTKGVLGKFTSYVDADDSDFYLPAMDGIKYKNDYYGICARPGAALVYYNKRLFENAGLKTPLEYWDEGSWSWDTLKELGTQLTIRQNGNVTQWGYSGYGADYVMRSNDGMYSRFNSDGGIDITIKDERTLKAFRYMQEMYVGNNAWAQYEAADSDKGFVDGTIAMTGAAAWNAEMNYHGKMSDEFGIVPFPAGPDVKADSAPGGSNWYVSTVNGAKNPAGAVAFFKISEQISKEKELESHPVWNQEHKDVFTRIKEMTIYSGYPAAVGIDSNILWNPICKQGKPISQTIEGVIPTIQKAIDSFLDEGSKISPNSSN